MVARFGAFDALVSPIDLLIDTSYVTLKALLSAFSIKIFNFLNASRTFAFKEILFQEFLTSLENREMEVGVGESQFFAFLDVSWRDQQLIRFQISHRQIRLARMIDKICLIIHRCRVNEPILQLQGESVEHQFLSELENFLHIKFFLKIVDWVFAHYHWHIDEVIVNLFIMFLVEILIVIKIIKFRFEFFIFQALMIESPC